MYPGQNASQQMSCPHCGNPIIVTNGGVAADRMDAARLHTQIAEQMQTIKQLTEEGARKDTLIANQKTNVSDALKQADEAQQQKAQTDREASESWKEVAVILEMELPEKAETLAYQGPSLYTKEYIFEGITRLKAKLLMAQEIIRQLQGRISLQKVTFDSQVKQIAAAMAQEAIAQIEGPREEPE